MKTRSSFFWLIPFLGLLVSCVPSRQYKELETSHQQCMDELEMLKIQQQKTSVENTEMKARLENQEKKIEALVQDSLERYREWSDLRARYNQLNRDYQTLKQTQDAMVKGNMQETGRLLRELQAAQENLQTKEDELRGIQADLQKERSQLDEMQFALEERNARLIELQRVLARKDSAVNALRSKVSNALLGYQNDGLSVRSEERRGGKKC